MDVTLAIRCLFLFSLIGCLCGIQTNDGSRVVPYSSRIVRENIPGKYVPKVHYMKNYCSKPLELKTRDAIRMGLWNKTTIPTRFTCQVEVQNLNYNTYDLGVTFKMINLTEMQDGSCIYASLNMYSGSDVSSHSLINQPRGICGTKAPREHYVTSNSSMVMVFKTGNLPRPTIMTMDAVITPLHKGKCLGDEFRCNNGYCIKNNGRCDTFDNCGDKSDEDNCGPSTPSNKNSPSDLSNAAIIGIAVGGALLVAMGIVICCCCCCCFCRTGGKYEKL